MSAFHSLISSGFTEDHIMRTTTTPRYPPRARFSASDRPVARDFDVDALISARRAERTSTPTISSERLRNLERALRSALARLERAITRTRSHRIALRMRGAPPARGRTGRTRSMALSARTLARHQELVAAIRRLEAGTYGACLRCGRPIAYERLLERPWATECTECAAAPTR
jgi:RNA polymerase-binding transcription factor DksA